MAVELCRINHGSYGAAPVDVIEAAAAHRRDYLNNPDVFFEEDHVALLKAARAAVGSLVGADMTNVALVDNATTGAACVAQSLARKWVSGEWAKGDRVLLSSTTYDSTDHSFRAYCQTAGAELVTVALPLPTPKEADVLELYRRALATPGPPFRVIVLDHIVSTTAALLPVEKITKLARAAGVNFVFIDGAHAPGQLPLALDKSDFDAYTGNMHKWAFASPGAAFLWAREPTLRAVLSHPIPSHDWPGCGFVAESSFLGTRDYSSWWCLPTALTFAQRFGGHGAIRARNRKLVLDAATMLSTAWGTEIGQAKDMAACMIMVALPATLGSTAADAARLRASLLAHHKIQVQYPQPATDGSRLYLRLSATVYNEMVDYERLRDAVLSEVGRGPTVARL